MLRTVADDTPSPLSRARCCDAIGSPVSMYSRTSVASSRRERSESSEEPIVCQSLRASFKLYRMGWSALLQRAVPAHGDGGDVRLGDLAVLHGNQLGQDAHGDFLRRNRTDVEADRRVNALETFRRQPLLLQLVVDPFHLRLAADETEVAKGRRGQRPE